MSTATSAELVYNPFSFVTQEFPYAIYRRLRDEAPVYHNADVGFYALSRYSDVVAAHLDTATFSNRMGPTIEPRAEAVRTLLTMDPPEHGMYRRLVNRSFTPRSIANLEPWVRATAADLLDVARAEGRLDAVAGYSAHFPVTVISELLGIPAEYRMQVKELADRTLAGEESESAVVPEDAMQAQIEYVMLLLAIIDDKRKHPGDDVITMMLNTEAVDDHGSSFMPSDVDTAARLLEMSLAGHETVAKLIGSGVVALWWSRDQRRELVENPALIPAAVEEMLRWDPPSQYQGRWTERDVELHGTVIPAENRVILVTGAASHDEREWGDDAGLFDTHRDVEKHVTFGWGAHLCIGAHLARLEARVAFEELLSRFPGYEVDTGVIVRAYSTNVRGLKNLPIVLEP
jgi:cytochrome P450